MPAGRPSLYSLEFAAAFCEKIASGMSVSEACDEHGMPHEQVVYKYIREKPEFKAMYAKAVEERVTVWSEKLLKISGERDDDRNAASRRLDIDTHKWLMCKLLPKKYGDKMDHAHSGGVTVEVVNFTDKDR